MGVMIQEVVGTRVGPYYLPAFAGVGFSLNEFRWSPRIERDDGLLRLVPGLGTRAVDRVATTIRCWRRRASRGCG
jgi:pyruvate, water dikinase